MNDVLLYILINLVIPFFVGVGLYTIADAIFRK